MGQALAADALIDSYISRKYTLPLASTPPVLIEPAAAIAFYKLHQERYSDEVRTAYEDALKFLKNIASGVQELNIGGREPSSAPADARVEAPARTFNRNSLKGL